MGSICIVTGAAGTIGKALIQSFSSAGYLTLGIDLCDKPDNLHVTSWHVMDLVKYSNDKKYAQDANVLLKQSIGKHNLSVLIHNAAVQRLGSMQNISRSDWDETFAVNLTAPFFLSQSLLPLLEIAQGSIIHIGSIHARLTKPGFTAYSTSKAAIAGLTRAMCNDLGPRVRVNAIEPAAIHSKMLSEGFINNPDGLRTLASFHPQGRIGTANEVAALALALVQFDLKFLNGACIPMDGGIGSSLHDPENRH